METELKVGCYRVGEDPSDSYCIIGTQTDVDGETAHVLQQYSIVIEPVRIRDANGDEMITYTHCGRFYQSQTTEDEKAQKGDRSVVHG